MSNVVSDSKPTATPTSGKDLPAVQEQPISKARQIYEFFAPIVLLLVILCAARSSFYDWNDVPSGSMLPTILEGDRVLVNKLAYDLKVPFSTTRIAEWSAPQRGEIVVFFSPEPGHIELWQVVIGILVIGLFAWWAIQYLDAKSSMRWLKGALIFIVAAYLIFMLASDRSGTRLIKRCVGVPGDQLEVQDDMVYINGVPQPWTAFNQASLKYTPSVRPNTTYQYFTETINGHAHAVRVMQPHPYPSWPNFGPITIPPGKFFMMGDNRDDSRDSRYFTTSGNDRTRGTLLFADRSNIVGRASRVAFSLDYKRSYLPRWARFFEALP